MDVAVTKQDYVDKSANGAPKSGTAEQLIGDFSAAVAERMKKAGQSVTPNGTNTFFGALKDTTNVRSEVSRESNTDYLSAPPQHNEAPAPREQVQAPADRDEAPIRDDVAINDAPRDSQQHDSPVEQHSDNNDNGARADQSSHNEGSERHEGDGAESAESQGAQSQDTAVGQEAQVVAAVQQVNVGEIAQVLAKDTSTVKTVLNDTGSKQKAQPGNQLAQNVTGGQNTGEDTSDMADLGAAAKKSKGASTQAQTGANTHLKADAQADAAKGPTVAQQQAADLAKKIGPNQALNVNVTVTKQSEELISKPTVNLAGQSNLKSEGESLTPTTAQASTKGQAQAVATHNPGGQNGADAQAQNQQQAQLQATQADAAKLAANASETKAAQNSNANSAVQGAKVGGAEGASAPQVTAAPAGPAQQANQAAATAKPQNLPQKQPDTPVTEQVKVQISKAINDGMDKIRIQLKPAHLGRIEIQLEMGQDGRVTAVISADTKDTMDLLKQDSRELERALREAGLNLNSGDLSFNMRGENSNDTGDDKMAQGKSTPAEPILEPTLDELMQMQLGQPQIISEDRVDITA